MTCRSCVYGEPHNDCGYTWATIEDVVDADKKCPNFTPYPKISRHCDLYGKACMNCSGCPEEQNEESEVEI